MFYESVSGALESPGEGLVRGAARGVVAVLQDTWLPCDSFGAAEGKPK